MDVVAIVGTDRRNGTLHRLVRALLGGAEERGHHTSLVNLFDHSIGFCRGCWACSRSGACVLGDDFDRVYQCYDAADAVVLASPVYRGSMSAVLKAFLERFTAHGSMREVEPDTLRGLSRMGRAQALLRVARTRGAHRPCANKKHVVVVSCTSPFPLSVLSGDVRRTVDGIRTHIRKTGGALDAKLVYTDTLFRLRSEKEAAMISKARDIGRGL